MNWDAIGAIAETLGAVAVVATLVYLSSQLRQNTAAMRAAKLESWAATGSAISQFRALHSEVLAKAFSGEATSPSEMMIVDGLAQQIFLLMEVTYLHHRDGAIERDVYEARLEGLMSALDNPLIRAQWDQTKGYGMTRGFVQMVDKTLLLRDA